MLTEVVQLARTMGLAGLGTVSVDGTKVRANASKRKAMSYGRMVGEERRLQAEIAGLLEQAEVVDAAEGTRYGEEFRGDELPEELKRCEDRLVAIRAAKARLEAERREMDDARGRKPGQARLRWCAPPPAGLAQWAHPRRRHPRRAPGRPAKREE